MKLKEAIFQSVAKSQKARAVKLKKALLKPMTPRLFIHIFNNKFRELNYGIPAAITSKDRGMLIHLIKYLSTELNTQAIVKLIEDLVIRWKNEIAEHEFTTVSNRKMTMPTRPNLRAFLFCKNDIVSFLTEKNEKVDVGDKKKPIIPV